MRRKWPLKYCETQLLLICSSTVSDTSCCVPVLGMGLEILQVPLHNVVLYSDLFQGEVAVGVHPALPIEGITFILGNGVAGGRVLVDVLPLPPVVCQFP